MRSRSLTGLFFLAVILLLAIPSFSIYYTDWLWFRELGYTQVFFKSLNTQGAVFIGVFAVAFAFLYGNLRIAQHGLVAPRLIFGQTIDGRPVAIERTGVARIALIGSMILAGMLAISSAANWMSWIAFFRAVPFGVKDPLLGRDVAFYVYRLPLFDAVRQDLLLLTAISIAGAGFLYLMAGDVAAESRYGVAFWPRLRLGQRARTHLSWLVAIGLALMAWGAWLDLPRTLITPASGETAAVVFGASYTDVHAVMPVLRLKLVILGLGSALAIWHGLSSQRWPVPLALAVYLVTTIGGSLYGTFIQQFVVTPNEQDKEQPFIIHNIDATRRAYSLDRIDERELTGVAELKAKDIIANADTIANVRLWDHQPLLQTFAQIQEIRTYYDFVSVDNDRYWINGKQRQVMLSARELNTDSLPNQSWVNNRLSFTHGYGLTLGPVNQVTTEGLPVLFIKDLPPKTTKDLPVTEPSLYFGEQSSDYVLVKTNTQEFHYPKSDRAVEGAGNDQGNVMTTYSGTGGVDVGGRMRRLLLAARFGSMEILVTNQLRKDSRILFHRKILDRVKQIAPFLDFDRDPYLVVDDGRLFWMIDAYTTTPNYPYASRVAATSGDRINYIRNSVKAVVDAYNGTTTFYLADASDPLALTIANIFPGIFKPIGDMPAGLRQHVRYPEDIFAIQSGVFATYHMTNPGVFYNKEDQWQVPVLDAGERGAQPLQPYYTIMKLPGEKHPEFIQMLPFTPRLKDNLSAWMVARSDGDQYGKLRVYQFPKQTIVYGPSQIEARINQDQVISPQITLWGQQGSTVKFGTLLVIPIEESLLYVRPLYLRSSTGKIPELKRVIVANATRIVMAETLTSALVELFGPSVTSALEQDRLDSAATSIVESTSSMPEVVQEAALDEDTLTELVADVAASFERGEKALRDGDLTKYGEEHKRQRLLFDRINKLIKK
jgi:uncharacterized membrane protein (UPF0182 family)